MSTTLTEIARQLDAIDIKYHLGANRIRLSFRTDLYEDADRDNSLGLTIWLEDDGETLRIQALNAYKLPKEQFAERLTAVQQTLNQLNWETKLAHYEMDTEDGEIRIVIDYVLEDGVPTDNQLKRLIYVLPHLADRDHAAWRAALDHGTTLLTRDELCRRFDDWMIARDKSLQ